MRLKSAMVLGLPTGQGWGPVLDSRHKVRVEGDRVIAELRTVEGPPLSVSIPIGACVLISEPEPPIVVPPRPVAARPKRSKRPAKPAAKPSDSDHAAST